MDDDDIIAPTNDHEMDGDAAVDEEEEEEQETISPEEVRRRIREAVTESNVSVTHRYFCFKLQTERHDIGTIRRFDGPKRYFMG